jgi:hypothetical protein
VTQVASTSYAFAALRADGSVVTWGDADLGWRQQRRGNKTRWHDRRDAAVFEPEWAFAALRADGSVVTWG